MKIHPQIIIKNNLPEFIVLPYKEYDNLLNALEDKEDIKAVKDFHSNNQKTIPFELLQSIANGKNAIRVFREFRKISQIKLAEQAGISRQYLCQIENGTRKGSHKVLKRIADILDVDIDLLDNHST